MLADEQVELRGDVLGLGGGMQDHRIGLGGEQRGVVVLALQEAVAVVAAHVLENGVAPDDDRGVAGDDQCPVTHLVGVGDQVVGRGRLQDGRQDGRLGHGQLAQVGDAEVALGGGRDAVALVAVEVEVQVGGDDRLLALVARELLRQPDRLDDLLDLPIDCAGRRRQKALPDELLGDRRGASGATRDRVTEGRQDGRGVEARVGPERLVFGAGRGVEDDVRDLGELEDAPVLGSEGGQLDCAGPVVEHRLLAEVEALEEGLGILEVLAVRRVDFHRANERDEAQDEERPKQEEREDDGDPAPGATASAMCAGSIAPTAFAPGEAGLHSGSQDSIGRRAGTPPHPAGGLDEQVRLGVTMKEQVAR